MMKAIGFMVCGLVLVVTIGCSKSGDSGDKPAPLTLAKLGLQAEAPAGSNVGDGIMGDGLLIQGEDLVVSVELASAKRSKTIKEDQADTSMYSPINVKTENLTDGWIHSFENKGPMGTNYFVHARREISGKTYWCETTSSSPEQRQNALNFCKSLKKG
jgi:hypothetical protein